MILGIFLSPGDSLAKQALVGQDQRFINYYLKEYSKKFKKVFIFSYGDNDYQKSLPLNVFLLPNKYNIPYFIYQFVLPIFRDKEISSCDIFRSMQTTGGIPVIIAKIFHKKKFVTTYGYDYVEFAGLEGKYIHKILGPALINLVLNTADKIIVTTKKNFRIFTEKYGGKAVLVPNGVDTDFFRPGTQSKTVKKKVVILTIGRLTRQKNQKLLIEAAAECLHRKSIMIRVIGNGPMKNQLCKLAKDKQVELEIIERVSNDKIPAMYPAADIFCLPSLTEGQSKVLLEALSCGLPVLASNNSANKEIILNKENGILFHLNSNDLAQKINWLINHPQEGKKLGGQGRRYVKKYHNLNKLIEKEIILLKNV